MGIGKGTGRGGKRVGAGMKAVDGLATPYRMSLSLDQVSVDLMEKHNAGNDSATIRRICHLLTEYELGSTPRKVVKKGPDPKMPVRRIVSEQMPGGGGKYNFFTLAKKQAEADAEYQAAMAVYLKSS